MNDYNIYAKFNDGETFTISEQSPYQFNYGQKLLISGTNVNGAVTQVHFSTAEKQGTAEQRVGTVENGVIKVDLPDSLIFNEKFSGNFKIYAFVYVTDGRSGETLYKVQINVIARPKPKEIITPDHSDMFDGVVAKVSEDARRAENAANRAESSIAKSPKIIDGYWHVWDTESQEYVNTGVPASGSGGGGTSYVIGNGLKLSEGNVLSVDAANKVEMDNTKPITSSAVYTEVGNISALLSTI